MHVNTGQTVVLSAGKGEVYGKRQSNKVRYVY
jgi:hypothetical protein